MYRKAILAKSVYFAEIYGAWLRHAPTYSAFIIVDKILRDGAAIIVTT